jgi:hypothetical protein
VLPDSSVAVDVQLGTAVEFNGAPLDLVSDVYAVDLLCDGRIAGGGVEGVPSVTGGQGLELFVSDFSTGRFPCRPYAASDLDGRHITLDGHRTNRSGLRVSRKIHAPADAAFTRYLEVLENPLPVDVTVRVRIDGSVASMSPFVPVLDQTVAFIMDGFSQRAGVGLVFGDWSAALADASVNWSQYAYEWHVTIPAGETRRLLHYFLQAPAGQFSPALLWELTAPANVPGALDGLTAEELASIVNFTIQP